MASTVSGDRVDEMYGLLRAARWADAAALYERGLSREEKAAPEIRLAYAIGLLRGGRERNGLAMLDREVLALPHSASDLRRFVISDWQKSGALEAALAIVDRLIRFDPASLENRWLRVSILRRMKRWEDAIEDTLMVARGRPEDLSAQRTHVQNLVQARRLGDAGAYASSLGKRVLADPALANIALLALTRSGRMSEAGEVALEMAESEIMDEGAAAAIVRTLVDCGWHAKAIDVGERLLHEGWEHEVVRANVAEAYLASRRADRHERAAYHLREGLEIVPNDPRMNLRMGEVLLRTRNYEAALPFLATACEVQPNVPQPHALYARALKQVGRYAEAAREFRTLLDMQPSSPRWARYAAGALSQAGRRKEAAELFDRFVAERRTALPRNFEQGLRALWDRVASVNLPQARLDWAWSLSGLGSNDREEWERRAKWGHLADHYLLDWLECRDDRVQDAMMRLADLGDAERALAAIDRSNGMILASAHIGPMFAGPLALELLGVRSRWLASTPSVARTSYASSLISTSEQDDMQVGKAFMRALRKKLTVVIAVDGAINMAAPTVPFEGQEITYSSFAARTAHRREVPSAFCAPRWEGGRIGFVIERMPDPEPNEDTEAFANRWRAAYLDSLRRYLAGAPENLRLSGGLWRQIR